ncbi:MAG: 4-hydroxybutyrate--acetyl-CoA CoA transferase [Oscillospiraceae bacterium]|nr:4-hydroxybutyrate--acetyl-CoA CoA transferase [Oscillospiraceae bacterium]
MTKQELYESKFITLEEALGKIRSGDTIAQAAYGNEPLAMLRNLHTIADRGVEDVCVWMGSPQEEYPFISDPNNNLDGVISVNSIFFGAPLRKQVKKGSTRINFCPNNLHSMSQVMMETRKPNIFWAAVTPMDRYGYVAVSCTQQAELEMLDSCDMIIFEVNPQIPYTSGTVRVPIEKVNYFISVDYPITEAPIAPATPQQLEIAHYASSLIKNGDTIQLGIGGLPDAVAHDLEDRHDLGIYTEMISTSMGKLMWCGAVNNSKKMFFRNRTIGAFCWGSRELYDYINDNPMVEILPTAYVNNPFNIMKNDNMVSLNTALEIDLTGQVCSESIGSMQYSGTGGATDFAYGAYHAKGGKGIIAINATAKGGTISRIVPQLKPGAVVSISRNIVDYIVTEYGIAKLRGKTVAQRVEELINVAAPEFRSELRREAQKLQLR